MFVSLPSVCLVTSMSSSYSHGSMTDGSSEVNSRYSVINTGSNHLGVMSNHMRVAGVGCRGLLTGLGYSLVTILNSSDIHDSITDSPGHLPRSGDRMLGTLLLRYRVTHWRCDHLSRYRLGHYSRSSVVRCGVTFDMGVNSPDGSTVSVSISGLSLSLSLPLVVSTVSSHYTVSVRDGCRYSSLHQTGGCVHYMRVMGGCLRGLSTHSPHNLLTGLCDYSVLMDIKHGLAHLPWVLRLPRYTLLYRGDSTDGGRGITSMRSINSSVSLRISFSISLSFDDGSGTEAETEQEYWQLHGGCGDRDETASHLVEGAEAVSH